MKTCTGCKQSKDSFCFNYSKTSLDGLGSRCKLCQQSSKARNRFQNQNYARKLLSGTQSRAKQLGLEFDLDLEWIVSNKPLYCPITGASLEWGTRDKHRLPTVDKVDPKGGYTKSNCKIISWEGNRLKSNLTLGQCYRLIEYIEGHQAAI